MESGYLPGRGLWTMTRLSRSQMSTALLLELLVRRWGRGGGITSGSALKLGRGLRCTGVSKICKGIAANISMSTPAVSSRGETGRARLTSFFSSSPLTSLFFRTWPSSTITFFDVRWRSSSSSSSETSSTPSASPRRKTSDSSATIARDSLSIGLRTDGAAADCSGTVKRSDGASEAGIARESRWTCAASLAAGGATTAPACASSSSSSSDESTNENVGEGGASSALAAAAAGGGTGRRSTGAAGGAAGRS